MLIWISYAYATQKFVFERLSRQIDNEFSSTNYQVRIVSKMMLGQISSVRFGPANLSIGIKVARSQKFDATFRIVIAGEWPSVLRYADLTPSRSAPRLW